MTPGADEERRPRCYCGHYESEHATDGCHGAYVTLAEDADDNESVEVLCPCRCFFRADHDFELRDG